MPGLIAGLSFIIIWLTSIVALEIRELHWRALLIQWSNDRSNGIMEVLSAANVITRHKFKEGDGGNLIYQGTLLNYETLAHLVMTEQEQKQLLVDHLKLWELDHPQPDPPTYFGKRLILA